MQVWILTFNRPAALTRQILTWGRAGYEVHVFSNHPDVSVTEQEALQYITQPVDVRVNYNSLSYPESNSWCARSWNSIFIKAFMGKRMDDGVVFVQDDTNCAHDFPTLIRHNANVYNFMWGPAGDQWFYMCKEVLANVGWFDERYLGCYCGDADFLLRVWKYHEKKGSLGTIAVEEHHDWGWVHQPVGIEKFITRDVQSKAIDASYVNQHEEMQNDKLKKRNTALEQSQSHFKAKWGLPGNGINGIGPLISHKNVVQQIPDIDWYPWFTEKHLQGK
jgi:hypothetical protein